MFKVLSNAWKVQDIRNKLIFIMMILAIYRFGTHIALPGIHPSTLAQAQSDAGVGTLFSLITGGGTASVFALGIGPYITASIIMQLLTVAISPLERLQKEGEEGRKKISQYTRILALILATLQASGYVYSYAVGGLFSVNSMFLYFLAVLSMVTGTIVIMWLGELITERGLGNGSSFIIFSNIISRMPVAFLALYYLVRDGGTKGITEAIFTLVIFVLLVAFVVLIQDGERRIPVQYSKKGSGRDMLAGGSQYIPLKVNIAGVMSIIFAISIVQAPAFVNQLWPSQGLNNIVNFLSLTSWTGLIVYVVLIFVFTFFYTSFAINPIEMAENMKKNASFIPGIRPGKPTSDFINTSVYRLSWIGAACYAFLAAFPIIIQILFGIKIGVGGTTLLIVTGVALDLVKQLESQLLVRHYKGFLS